MVSHRIVAHSFERMVRQSVIGDVLVGLSIIPVQDWVDFQNGALFDSMTVFDNLAYPLREHTDLSEEEISKKVRDLLDEFNLSTNDLLYPSELSGGMQKRASLARAIAISPEIIFFDEPTTGLDPIMADVINDLIISNSKELGATTITSAISLSDFAS